jgi:hypothetical protein
MMPRKRRRGLDRAAERERGTERVKRARSLGQPLCWWRQKIESKRQLRSKMEGETRRSI